MREQAEWGGATCRGRTGAISPNHKTKKTMSLASERGGSLHIHAFLQSRRQSTLPSARSRSRRADKVDFGTLHLSETLEGIITAKAEEKQL